jgi:folate-binding protein YgfZ
MTPLPSPAEQLRALRTAVGVVEPSRGFVLVEGADAEKFLQNLLSQELRGMIVGEARQALFLTPKARVIADPRVTLLDEGRFLLDLDPVGVDALVHGLTRYRLGAKVAIDATSDWSLLSLIGPDAETIATDGVRIVGLLGDLPRVDVLVPTDQRAALVAAAIASGATPVEPDAIEALRIAAGAVRLGHDADERWMPAEVGLVETTVSFEKGCFIGQEPVTRLHRRGHANRGPRRLSLDAVVELGTTLELDGKDVGVITSVAAAPWFTEPRAIGIVRVDVPDGSVLTAGAITATVLA